MREAKSDSDNSRFTIRLAESVNITQNEQCEGYNQIQILITQGLQCKW